MARRWEPWHFGYTGGPPPCSDAGDQVGMPPGDGEPEPPVLNNKFVPYVRGNRYTEIGSTGALTLISLAWQLALFERAVEQGEPHPGLLLIDSPQKNLKPETGGAESDEFVDPAIPRVWEHIVNWSARHGGFGSNHCRRQPAASCRRQARHRPVFRPP